MCPSGRRGAHVPGVVAGRHRPATANPDDADCTGQPGSGFFNTATLTVGAIPIDDDGLHPRGRPRLPDGHQDRDVDQPGPGTGDWTITYDIEVTLAATGPANPLGLSAEYDLDDTLDFGGDINIGSAEWSGESSGTFAGPDAPRCSPRTRRSSRARPRPTPITVVAEVTPEAVDSGTAECDAARGRRWRIPNTALLSSGGQDTPVEACAEPVFPEIEKSHPWAGRAGPRHGCLDGQYDITVTYPATDPTRSRRGYVLTDEPELPGGVELVGDWTLAAATRHTDAGRADVGRCGHLDDRDRQFDPEDDGITQHVFTVSAEVSVTRRRRGSPSLRRGCRKTGIVVLNRRSSPRAATSPTTTPARSSTTTT